MMMKESTHEAPKQLHLYLFWFSWKRDTHQLQELITDADINQYIWHLKCYVPQLKKKTTERPILTISSTIVIPFLFALLSKYLRVNGGCAQYCNANRNMVVSAAVDSVSLLAATLAAAPPMMESGDWAFSASDLAVWIGGTWNGVLIDVNVWHAYLMFEWCLTAGANAAMCVWWLDISGAMMTGCFLF